MNRLNRSCVRLIAILLASFVVMNLSSCLPIQTGTADEALTARARMQIGQALLTKAESEISNLLAGFRDVEPAALLISEPPTLPLPLVFPTDLNPLYGVYTETGPGVFDFVAGVEQTVLVQYVNGIDVSFANFTFTGTQGQLDNYSLTITSNNRVATPVNEVVVAKLDDWRPDLGEQVTLPITPSVASLKGTLRFVDSSATAVNYQLIRQKALGAGQTLAQVSLAEFNDFRILDVGTRQFWHRSKATVFVPSDVPGAWAMWSVYSIYDDNNVLYSTMPLMQGSVVNGVANYVVGLPRLNLVTYNNLLVGTVSDKRIGSVVGGPYSCDVNAPAGMGVGTPIVVNWVDGAVTNVLPGDLNCPELIFVEPPAPPA